MWHLRRKKHQFHGCLRPYKKFKRPPFAKKVMTIIFWSHQSEFLVDFLTCWATMSATSYCATLDRLRSAETIGTAIEKFHFVAWERPPAFFLGYAPFATALTIERIGIFSLQLECRTNWFPSLRGVEEALSRTAFANWCRSLGRGH